MPERGFGLAAAISGAPPDQFGLDDLKEGLDGGIVVTVALCAYRRLQAVLAQHLLMILRTSIGCPLPVPQQRFAGKP